MELSRAQKTHTSGNGKPIEPRNFGYGVSVRAFARPTVQTESEGGGGGGGGGGSPKAASYISLRASTGC